MKEPSYFGDPLPEGVPTELTVTELEEMACRQQQQIDSQRQLLAAKEQRLRFLKQNEAKHEQVAAEHERLRRLRDRVEAQEQKLRKLRALRGQVDQTKMNNVSLTSDLESIRALFNEKEKELSVAVAKVEELTRQLEELQKGRATTAISNQLAPTSAAIELERLRSELMYRNKLNEQQSARLSQQRDVLAQRQEEMAAVDRRIAELQERLHKKRILNQQIASQHHHNNNNNNMANKLHSNISTVANDHIQANNIQLRKHNNNNKIQQPTTAAATTTNRLSMPHHQHHNVKTSMGRPVSSGNIAAVEPYHHVPNTPSSSSSSTNRKDDDNNNNYEKKLNMTRGSSNGEIIRYDDNNKCHHHSAPPYFDDKCSPCETEQICKRAHVIQQDDLNKLKHQSIMMNKNKYYNNNQITMNENNNNNNNNNNDNKSIINRKPAEGIEHVFNESNNEQSRNFHHEKTLVKLNEKQNLENTKMEIDLKCQKDMANEAVVKSQLQQRGSNNITLGVSAATIHNNKDTVKRLSNVHQIDKQSIRTTHGILHSHGLSVGNASRSAVVASLNSHSNTFSNTQQHQKPISSVSPIYQTSSTRVQPVQPQILTSNGRRIHHQYRGDNQNTKPALPPKPSPPIKATPPPPPRLSPYHAQHPELQTKSLEQRIPSDNGRLESRLEAMEIKENSHQLNDKHYPVDFSSESDDSASRRGYVNTMRTSMNGKESSKRTESPPPLPAAEPPSDDEVDKLVKYRTTISLQKRGNIRQSFTTSDRTQDSSSSDTSSTENNYFIGTNRRIEMPPAYLFPENDCTPVDLLPRSMKEHESSDDTDNIIMDMKNVSEHNDSSETSSEKPGLSSSPDSDDIEKMNCINKERTDDVKRIRKGNLKHSGNANSKRRVSFDPLALLLDASLEGELELVIRTAGQVKNPSAANDEGITALHNAICAGHIDIVRFLVQFGCDVNAQDSDGWTPLHCAASCNNLSMVQFLVEHGACIFATTLSDQETAAEKCEEDEEGFDGCSEFLYSIQEKLGILNNGTVYAVFDYEAHNPDELSFKEGDRITVLRKGDEWEREWWWSRIGDKEGYIPRNLLGLYPRVHADKCPE